MAGRFDAAQDGSAVLIDRLRDYFSANVRRKGEEYFSAGAVLKLVSGSPQSYQASVRGSTTYTVEFRIPEKPRDSFAATCSCSYADNYGDYCKHIWAALLALEESLAEDQPADAIAEDEDDDFVDEYGSPVSRSMLWRIAGLMQSRAQPSRPGHSSPPAPPPPWSDLLNSVRRASHYTQVESAGRIPAEPAYVFEAERYARFGTGVDLYITDLRTTAQGRLPGSKSIALRPAEIPRLGSELDRQIALALVAAAASTERYYAFDRRGNARWKIPAAWTSTIVPMLCRTGRLFLRQRNRKPVRLTLDEGAPFELVLSVSRDKGAWALEGQFRRGEKRISLGAPAAVLDGRPGVLIHGTRIHRLETHGCHHWIAPLRDRGTIPVATNKVDEFLKEIAGLRTLPPLDLPPDWGIDSITDCVPVPELSLDLEEEDRRRYVEADVCFRYETFRAGGDSTSAVVLDLAGRRLIRRHVSDEKAYLSRLCELGAAPDTYGEGLRFRARDMVTHVLPLARIQEGFALVARGDASLKVVIEPQE